MAAIEAIEASRRSGMDEAARTRLVLVAASCFLRLTQGLAVGGEYGSAATYVAEHARSDHRGYYTSWLQTTSTIGLALAIGHTCRLTLGDEAFETWGWRVPFLTSMLLLAVSVYIRLKLEESPVYQKMKPDGRTSKIADTGDLWFLEQYQGRARALFGITSGMTVIWYGAQFYAVQVFGIQSGSLWPRRSSR